MLSCHLLINTQAPPLQIIVEMALLKLVLFQVNSKIKWKGIAANFW